MLILATSPSEGAEITGLVYVRTSFGTVARGADVEVFLVRRTPAFEEQAAALAQEIERAIAQLEADFKSKRATVNAEAERIRAELDQVERELDQIWRDEFDQVKRGEWKAQEERRNRQAELEKRKAELDKADLDAMGRQYDIAFEILDQPKRREGLRATYRGKAMDLLRRNAVKTTRTDVTGRYTFTAVRPGRYLMFASFELGPFRPSWEVPVEVGAGTGRVAVDLSNSNLSNH